MLIEHLSLTKITSAVLVAAGAPSAHADAVAHHLVEANLKGHDSHGVGMVPSYVKGMMDQLVDPHRHAQIVKDNGAIVSIDAGTGLGRVVGIEAMDIGVERTKKHGLACVALGNAAHLGRIGAFAEHCADYGLVSMHYVNVVGHDPMVVAFGGRDRRFITNPYCAGTKTGWSAYCIGYGDHNSSRGQGARRLYEGRTSASSVPGRRKRH